MDSANTLTVGDVITCDAFVKGCRTNTESGNEDGGYTVPVVLVGCSGDSYPVYSFLADATLGSHVEQRASYDPSRLDAKFLVVKSKATGGNGPTSHDHGHYPDWLHVWARRLTTKNFFDPNGEVILFFPNEKNNYSDGCVDPRTIKIVQHLDRKMSVVWE